MRHSKKTLDDIWDLCNKSFAILFFEIIIVAILIIALSGCTTITVTKPDATYSVTVPPFVKADSVSISRDGDDWTFDLNGGSTGDIEAITEAVTAGVVRGMK